MFKGQLRFTTSMLFAVRFIAMFIIGGPFCGHAVEVLGEG